MNKVLEKREIKTINFVKKHLESNAKILDLGVENHLGNLMAREDFQVSNTKGEDLDVEFEKYEAGSYDCVTAFEIFEHLLAPYNILKTIKSKYLIASIPMRLWFATSYW